ncbi:hypothetical protein M7I_2959 [Glarea lozoyensis 74030]|uniref:Protein ZIP4 homolog n=1 Tax=Glarea lozoyensis (strain ATCC 74030 / MF5533) TaxID=1104152 RepID=H0EK68_GLAL7|nr:hypothetical protein M7I_2959 [Glarea lozoyensis 74030]
MDETETLVDKLCMLFEGATAIVTLARGEDNIQKQLQYYVDLRKHVASFDKLLSEKLERMEEFQSQDLLQKLSILLTFDFEAACHLKKWDELGHVILNANICKSMRAYELMADCAISISPPTQALIATLKKIVNEAWALECVNSVNLAKYMRCLFQIALLSHEETAETLLDQVAAHAREASETDEPYPSEELDWIATKAFNHAVDLYLGQQEDACKVWASKAINVAHFVNDEGALERLLQEKLAGLLLDT